MREILIIMKYNERNPSVPEWNRTLDSLIKEWDIHNQMYELNIKRSSAEHVDLDNEDEGKGYTEYVLDGIKSFF